MCHEPGQGLRSSSTGQSRRSPRASTASGRGEAEAERSAPNRRSIRRTTLTGAARTPGRPGALRRRPAVRTASSRASRHRTRQRPHDRDAAPTTCRQGAHGAVHLRQTGQRTRHAQSGDPETEDLHQAAFGWLDVPMDDVHAVDVRRHGDDLRPDRHRPRDLGRYRVVIGPVQKSSRVDPRSSCITSQIRLEPSGRSSAAPGRASRCLQPSHHPRRLPVPAAVTWAREHVRPPQRIE
jgi:hypothetical protein